MNRICLLLLFFTTFASFGQKKPPKDSLKILQSVFSEADNRAKKYLPQYAPLSPNASSFQKFGDYQVNLATGIPDISIPIASAKSGSLTLPITLRYHAGGVRMSEQASWVGLGWSLDYGVSLNRSVQGLPDQLGSGLQGYLDASNYITQSKNFCNNATDFQYGQFLRDGVLDGEPDLFSYAIPSKSGRYILGQTTPDNVQLPTATRIKYLIVKKEFKIPNLFGYLNINSVDYYSNRIYSV